MDLRTEYLNSIRKNLDIRSVRQFFDRFKKLKVLVIGDTIIDEYIFVHPKGRAVKDPILSVEHRFSEIYPGGAIAIANHLNSFVAKVKLVTLIGDQESRLEFIKSGMKENVELKTFTKPNSPTTIKRRFIDLFRNNKLFKIEYMNDKPLNEAVTSEIVNYLETELPKYDLVFVGDFGHGFINEPIRRTLEKNSKFLAINVQSNSSNMGFNYFNLYNKFDFISMDEQELRLPLSRRFEPVEEVIRETNQKFNVKTFLVTQGKKGCSFFNDKTIFSAPILTDSVKDTVGAGDAVFAITSLFVQAKANSEIIPFLANCAGGIAANIVGNKESVTNEKMEIFLKEVLK